MKQRIRAFAAAAAVAALLAGCSSISTQQPKDGAPELSSDEANASSSLADLFDRSATTQSVQVQTPETVELAVQSGGREQVVTATVYTGTYNYSLSIPEGWERAARQPQWRPAENDQVSLTVRLYAGKTSEQVMELVKKSAGNVIYTDPVQTNLSNGHATTVLRGSAEGDEETGEESIVRSVYLVGYMDANERFNTYALLTSCPEGMLDTYGGYLDAIAYSFTLRTA
jgi:hypothetical protein